MSARAARTAVRRERRPTKRDALIAVCTLARSRSAGTCAWCGEELPPRRRSWCSDRCGDAFWANHWWSVARRTAKRRDRYRCKRCGAAPPKRPVQSAYASRATYLAAMRAWRKAKRTIRLEVNHIVPCRGKHAALDCAHHLDNLETLCPPCHRTHTSALRPPARSPAIARRTSGAAHRMGTPSP
ncbi:MAG TPA: HNH endonuclease [Candidatus Elarobacter sp.]|nr:HNH endonuclease [Candidatus Elarobacter sp.]